MRFVKLEMDYTGQTGLHLGLARGNCTLAWTYTLHDTSLVF
jgi:hypothetical protein